MIRNTVAEALAAQMLEEQDKLLSKLEVASEKLDKATSSSAAHIEKITTALHQGSDNFRGAVSQFIEIAKEDIEEYANSAAKRAIAATAQEQQNVLKNSEAERFNKEISEGIQEITIYFKKLKLERKSYKLRFLLLFTVFSLISGISSSLITIITIRWMQL